MRIINKTKNTVLAENVFLAVTLLARMKGLLGRKELKEAGALLLKPCSSIHTFFMGFPIDVIFVDSQNKIIGLKNSLPPWRLSRIYWRGKFAVELPSGVLLKSLTVEGDEISLV